MLDRARWQLVEQVLDRVLDAPVGERARALADACGGDIALREDVEALLAHELALPPMLADGAPSLLADLARNVTAEAPDDPLVGERLGRWRVRHEVGRGGMARVFLAERADGEFAQRAALKVLRAGLDSEAERARFEAERRILAALDHPFIARLLDGGVVPDGRPYLVLEYVEGEPITSWCATHALDLRARLALFCDVCEAVASAHRQLVVHRDLKPGNVLVGSDGRPRLLDFGIAKLLDEDGADTAPPSSAAPDAHSTYTRTRWLSPDYAAPEQFRGARVTTLTDVYQLGAVLFELVAERRPFDADALRRDPLRTEAPPVPSAVRPGIDGDLDAIVAKAMRPEPALRYASVAELADDVRRHLDGAPVQARVGERAYRWRRAARRNRWPLAFAASAAVGLLAWGATLTMQNARIRAALATAQLEREKSAQVADFLVGLFQVTDPRLGRADTISARALLDRGEERIEALASQPALQAALLGVVGGVRTDLGAFAEGERALRRALALRGDGGGAADDDRVRLHADLARVAGFAAQLDTAAHYMGLAYETARALHGDTAASTRAILYEYAFTLHSAERDAEADTLFLRWEQSLPVVVGTADSLQPRQLLDAGLAMSFGRQRDSAQRARGEALLARAFRQLRAAPGTDPDELMRAAAALARLRSDAGDGDGMDSLMRIGIAALDRVHPNGHPNLAAAMQMHAALLMDLGRTDDGMAAYDAAITMATATYGGSHLMVAVMYGGYGDALRRAGRTDSARVVLTTAVRELGRHAGESNVMTLRGWSNLGDVLGVLGEHRQAERHLVSSWEALSRTRGRDDRHAQYALAHLVQFYERTGRTADAARYRAMTAEPGDTRRGTAIP